MTKGLSHRQKDVLDCISHYIDENGYGPSVRDICSILELSSPSTVHAHLKALESKGYIKKGSQKSRSITLVNHSPEDSESAPAPSYLYPSYSDTVSLPIVGDVAAGIPILAEENITEYINLPVSIVGDSSSFLLKVRGESMIEAGINSGDFLVIKEQKSANNGDIVVAMIEDEATVKRFYKERDRIRLQPENSSMEPIYCTDCSIVGKVVALFRSIR